VVAGRRVDRGQHFTRDRLATAIVVLRADGVGDASCIGSAARLLKGLCVP
jgi:hypothetical protein